MKTKYFMAVAILTILLCSCDRQTDSSESSNEFSVGQVIFSADFSSDDEKAEWKFPENAAFIHDEALDKVRLDIKVEPSQKPGSVVAIYNIDLTPYKGMRLLFSCKMKADNVSRPGDSWNGCKFMLHIFSESLGEQWINVNNLWGTFEWREVRFSADIPKDVSPNAKIILGLQDSYGSISFADIKVTILRVGRPEPPLNPPPAFKGHNLPRLRGAMAGTKITPEDLRFFSKEWNGNLIRWQFVRNWGVPDTDRDTVEYNNWLRGELDYLDKLIPYCKEYGIMLVLDMHSPPGGRYENNDIAMFYEPMYADLFVNNWKMLAERYKGENIIWGFDLLNEPVQSEMPQEGEDYYLQLQKRAALAIRDIDPLRTIIFAADEWDSPHAFANLMPVDIKNVIYQVHMYWPHEYTHQGVGNSSTGLVYPSEKWNKEALRKQLAPVREFQLAYNVHIYTGEFSVIRWAEGAGQYLSDCIELFEEYGWDWSYHAFREWDGWSLEHGSDKNSSERTTETNPRKETVLKWFKQNIPAN